MTLDQETFELLYYPNMWRALCENLRSRSCESSKKHQQTGKPLARRRKLTDQLKARRPVYVITPTGAGWK